MLKQVLKRMLPSAALSSYHKTLAIAANVIYRFPSRELVVVGVTGTKGKSSTAIMIARILEEAGFTVGSTNTVFFKIGEREWPNNTKQGMPGRFALQRMLRAMVGAGCTHAVIEVTSEGVAQHRHWGIAFDVAVFANLSREHIESHGSYESYRAAKLAIFRGLRRSHRKTINNKEIKKVIVANAEDAEAAQFLKFKADEKWSVSCDPSCVPVLKDAPEKHLCVDGVKDAEAGAAITLEGRYIQLPFHGAFMAANALLAIAVGRALGIPLASCESALENMDPIPGRVEMLKTKTGATVVIDYAHEPRSFEAILTLGRSLAKKNRVISVFGAPGGGRDRAKRPVMGHLAAQYSDRIILTTDDPYDDDPLSIAKDILPGITSQSSQWKEGTSVFIIANRKQAITKALALAEPNDVVLLLGKGSEQVMAVAHGKKVPWSDREAAQAFIARA